MVFPFKHRMLLLKITERKLRAPEGDAAYLWQRYVLVPTERTRSYDEPKTASQARQLPIGTMTILDRELAIAPPSLSIPPTEVPPQSTPGPFVPRHFDGSPVLLDVEVVDGGGNTLRLRVPFVWAPTSDWGSPVTAVKDLQSLYAPVARADAGGQKLWLAPQADVDPADPGKPRDNTTFRAHAVTFRGSAATANSNEVFFHPVLEQAELAVDSIRQLVGTEPVVALQYAEAYLSHEFGAGNAREVLLKIADSAPSLGASFAAQADKLGSFVSPSFDIRGLSRTMGPITEVDPIAAATALGDPTKLFPGGNPLEILDAKLFGCMKLADVLGVGGSFADLAPKFIADAMHEVDRYRQLFEQVQGKAKKVADRLTGFDPSKLPPAVSSAVSSFVSDLETSITTVVDTAKAAAQEILDAPGKVKPDDPGSIATERDLLDTRIDAFITAVRDLPARWLSSKELAYVYPIVPQLEVAVRETTALLQRIVEVVTDVKKLIDDFLRGVELVACQQLTIDWRPPLRPFPYDYNAPHDQNAIFRPRRTGGDSWDGLTLSATIRGKRVGDAKQGVDLLCALEKFDLVLVGHQPWLTLHFDKLQFRKKSGKKPEVDVVFGGLEFGGPLSFIQTLRDILPLDGFSDPPGVDVTPSGIVASYSMGLPDVAIGMFSLENMAISARLEIPFIGDSMSFRFAFCSRERPFTLTVCGLGGTGFFALEMTPKGLTALEAQLEFGARISINLGVASGSVSVMGGVYFGWFLDAVKLTGFVRIRGEVSVLDLISASIELYMALEYRTEPGDFSNGKVVGRAYLEIEVSIAFFSKTVRIEVERKLAGAAGDPSFQDSTSLSDFNAYRLAFAA